MVWSKVCYSYSQFIMRTSRVVVCFLAAFSCLVSSSTSEPQDKGEGCSDKTMNKFHQDITYLRELVEVLRDMVVEVQPSSSITSERTTRETEFVDRLLRRKRDMDTSLSRPKRDTNESDANADALGLRQYLLGAHHSVRLSGVVYTHWGRSDCPNGSKLVYTGTTAGAYYTHTGSGSNYLCMPLEPSYGVVEPTAHASRGLIYSAEFETNTANSFTELHDQTPACAVCQAPPTHQIKLMVPGRNVCPSSDWRLEYKGYLMSAAYTQKRSEFICMDDDAEAIPGTFGSQDGALFYMVEGRCMSGGGLPCGPYVDGHELTCALCTI